MRVLAPSRGKFSVGLGVGSGRIFQECLANCCTEFPGAQRDILRSSAVVEVNQLVDEQRQLMSLSPRLFDSLARVQSHAHARKSQSERNSLSPSRQGPRLVHYSIERSNSGGKVAKPLLLSARAYEPCSEQSMGRMWSRPLPRNGLPACAPGHVPALCAGFCSGAVREPILSRPA